MPIINAQIVAIMPNWTMGLIANFVTICTLLAGRRLARKELIGAWGTCPAAAATCCAVLLASSSAWPSL